MKNKLTSNIVLKLTSLFIAVVIWLLVTNIDNPSIPRSFSDVPIKLINADLITNSGQVYEILDDTGVIDKVTVVAPRSIISSISQQNIVAIADVNDLSSLDTISIKLSTNIYSNQINSITGNIDTVKLKIENNKTSTLAITATTSGKVEAGYMLGDSSLEQNMVRISGPESLITKVAKAVVDVDVSGFTSDIGTDAEIKLYDEEGNVIKSDNITQNIYVVRAKVTILQTKDVPLVYHVSGSPIAGYRATGIVTGEAETVRIAGKSSVLKNVNSIEIPETVLDISGTSENYVTEIDIRKYLPENTVLADTSKAKMNVTVNIEREASKKLEIREERVGITNIPEGYRASISELGESFIIEVIGLSAEISAIQANNVSGTVDILKWMQEEGMTEPIEGYFTVDVDFGLTDNISLLEPVTVTLHLSKMEEEEQ